MTLVLRCLLKHTATTAAAWLLDQVTSEKINKFSAIKSILSIIVKWNQELYAYKVSPFRSVRNE